MLCSKILVAYDGSELAQKSLEKAMQIARSDSKIKIEVLHVIAVPHSVLDNLQGITDAIYQEGEDIIANAKLALATLPNPHQTYLFVGSPAYHILEHAKEYHCDLIIMGSRGLDGIKELFLGSVSHAVVQHAKVPVLIVK